MPDQLKPTSSWMAFLNRYWLWIYVPVQIWGALGASMIFGVLISEIADWMFHLTRNDFRIVFAAVSIPIFVGFMFCMPEHIRIYKKEIGREANNG
jgi:TctA family transporter